MAHKTEVVGYQKLSDGEYAIVIRCCGDEKHESAHTLNHEQVIDAEKRNARVAEAHTLTAKQHEIALRSEDELKALDGQTVEHDI